MARQIGQATVNVYPSMRGFNTAIYAEFDTAGGQAGARFTNGFKRSTGGMRNVLEAITQTYKTSLASALGTGNTARTQEELTRLVNARTVAQNKLNSANKAVEVQELKVQSARLKTAEATARVTRLENEIATARAKNKDTSRLEERLISARATLASVTARQVQAENRLVAEQTKQTVASTAVDRTVQAYSRLSRETRNATREVTGLGRASQALRNFQYVTGGTSLTGLISGLTRADNVLTALRARASAVGSALSAGFTTAIPAVRNLASNVASVASELAGITIGAVGGLVASNVSGGVERFDILTRFPQTMKAMGVSSRDARNALDRLTDGIEGLPTKLPEAIQTFNQILPVMGNNVERATDLTIALNNAMLAGGNGAEEAQRGLTQLLQLFASGSFSDLRGWRSAMEVANVSMTQLARYMMGDAKASALQLWDALKEGTYTMDDLQQAFIDLNNGVDGYVSFADLAKANTVGIDTSMRNMNTAIQNAVASFLDMSGAGALIRDTLDNITEKIKGFRKELDPLGSEISDTEAQIEELQEVSDSQAQLGVNTEEVDREIVQLMEHLEDLKSRRATAGVDALISKFGMGNSSLGGTLGIATATLLPLLRHVPLLGRLFTRITGPIGLAVGAVVSMWTESDKLRSTFGQLWENAGKYEILDRLKTIFDSLSTTIGTIAGTLGDLVSSVVTGVGDLYALFNGGEGGTEGFIRAIQDITDRLNIMLNVINVVVSGIKAIFTGDIYDISAFQDALDDLDASWEQWKQDMRGDVTVLPVKPEFQGGKAPSLSEQINEHFTGVKTDTDNATKALDDYNAKVDAVAKRERLFKNSSNWLVRQIAREQDTTAINRLRRDMAKKGEYVPPAENKLYNPSAGANGMTQYQAGLEAEKARKAGKETANAYADGVTSGSKKQQGTVDEGYRTLIQNAADRAKMAAVAGGTGGGSMFGNSVATGVRGRQGQVNSAGSGLMTTTHSRMSGLVGGFVGIGRVVGGNTAGGISASSGQASSAGSSLMSRVHSVMSTMLSGFVGIGSAIASGVASGISRSNTVNASLSGMITGALASARAKAQINSPSRLFRDSVGRYIGEGIAVGINNTAPVVSDAVENVIQQASHVAGVVNGINVGVKPVAGGSVGFNGADTGNTYNQNVTLYETNPAAVAQVIEQRWLQMVRG